LDFSVVRLFYSLFFTKNSATCQDQFTRFNGAFVENNGKTLVVYGDPNKEINKAEMVLSLISAATWSWAGRDLVQKGLLPLRPQHKKLISPREHSIWSEFGRKRFHDYSNQTTKPESYQYGCTVLYGGGDIVKWRDIDFRVLNTPGYTRDPLLISPISITNDLPFQES